MAVPTGLDWEVVVINNNCTDATDAVVTEASDTLPIRLVHEPLAGLSHARNRALLECRSDYILFTDDDVLVDSGWLSAFAEAASLYPGAAVFAGPVAPWFPVPPDPELLAAFPAIRNGFCGIDHRRPLGPLPARYRITGANMAFRVSTLSGLQFDPSLGVVQSSLGGGEETAFVGQIRARGGEVVWAPQMSVRHYVEPSRMTVPYLIRLASDRGRSSIREKGIPGGRRIAGAPARLWLRLLTTAAAALGHFVAGRRIRAAGRLAKFESCRAKISECRAMSRHGDRRDSL